ncbi:tetratricopeptide repeat protein [bacterium]|nr:tetratricopeptide repeat protein [bacterium]
MKKYIVSTFCLLILTNAAIAQDSSYVDEKYNEFYRNGVTFYKAKSYTLAIKQFRNVLRRVPYDATVTKALVSSYLARAEMLANEQSSYKNAVSDLKSALFYLKYWGVDIQAPELLSTAEINLKRISRESTDPAHIYKNAVSARRIGSFAEAGYDFSQLTENPTYSARAHEALGDIYKSFNNQNKAIESYRKILNAKNPQVYFKYALIMDEVNNQDAALEFYSLALQHGEKNPELIENLEFLWTSRIAQNPNDPQGYINLGAVLQKKGDLQGAKTQYLKAKALNPNDKIVLYNLASLYSEMNTPKEAILIYDEILSKEPNNKDLIKYKAQAQAQLKDIRGAISSYKTIIQLAPNTDDAKLAQAEIENLVRNNFKGQELIDYLTLEANSNPTNFPAQYNLAYELHKAEKYTEALAYYKRAMTLNPKYKDIYINMAQIHLNNKDTQSAKTTVKLGLSMLPTNQELLNLEKDIINEESNALYALASKYWNEKKYQDAISTYSKIPTQTPEIKSNIASCYFELKSYPTAIEIWEELLAQKPNDTNILNAIASCYLEMKNPDGAHKYYQKILSINPQDTNAKQAIEGIESANLNKKLDLAQELFQNKKYLEAHATLNEILTKDPQNLYANYYQGTIFEEEKKYTEAIESYKKVLSQDNAFSLAYYGLGTIYDTLENYNEAIKYYTQYIQSRDKDPQDDYLNFVKQRAHELDEYLKNTNNTN